LSYTFKINEDLLAMLDDYHYKTMVMEKVKFEKKQPLNVLGEMMAKVNIDEQTSHFEKSHFGKLFFDKITWRSMKEIDDLRATVNDDLILNVPIYDMGSRKYASFSSFTEAVWWREKDAKGNGIFFKDHKILEEIDWLVLFYLFRLCGSGINYKPKKPPFNLFEGSHGFGNFWIVYSILKGKGTAEEWLSDLKSYNKPFTDNKGYILPQFTFNDTKQHLKKYIECYAKPLVEHIHEQILIKKHDIYQVTDLGNKWLMNRGFNRQNFVLTAFACDIAEYMPRYVDPTSRLYAGTNAIKCIKAIFPKKDRSTKQFDYINDVLQFQSERYNLNPYDCEDSRNCDVIRYLKEYQSPQHIDLNHGNINWNNSILKKIWGIYKYDKFVKTL